MNIRNIFILIFLLSLHMNVKASVTITGNNVICAGQSTTLHAAVSEGTVGTTSYDFENIVYGSHPAFSGGTAVDPWFTTCGSGSGHDDCWAGSFDIGFTFCFFNQQYTKFYVGSNGWIGFTDPTTHSWTTFTATPIPPTDPPWSPSNPNPSVPKNCIFAPWQDWWPTHNSEVNNVFYYTTGTGTNHKLVVYWLNCPLYGCPNEGTRYGTFMIVLNEQTSIIENFIMKKPQCDGSTEGATQGVINLAGDIAFTATGRNYAVWTAANEGTRFTPSGIKWYKDALPPAGTFIGNGPDMTFSPTVTTTYFAVVGTCDEGTAWDSRTVTVNPLPPNPIITGPDNVCKGAIWDYSAQPTYSNYLWTAVTGDILSSSGNQAQVQWNTAGNQTLNLTYTTAEGCAPISPGLLSVTVNPFETPIITGTGELCAGEEATFSTQAGKTNYLWTYPGAIYVSGGGTTENTLTVKWASGGTKNITVNYTDGTGCTGNPPTSKEITVNPLPAPVISGDQNVCIAETNISYVTDPSELNYIWEYSPGITYVSGQGTNILTVNYSATGPQWVKVTYTDNKSCTGTSADYGIDVSPLPTASMDGSTSVCTGEPSQLITFTGTTGTAPYTFHYHINSGPSLSVTTTSGNSVTVSQPTDVPGTFLYTLESVDDANSCSQSQAGTATITVNPSPTATINGSTSVCQDAAPPLITFTGANATAPYTFTYKINGGPDQTVTTTSGNSVTIAIPTSAPGIYTYSLVSVQESSSTTCAQSQTGDATVTINSLPTATINGSTTVCQGTTSPEITFTGTNATAPYIFTYKINGGPDQTVTTTSGNSVSVPVPTGTPTSYTYTLVSVQESSSTTCSQPQTGNATVTVNPLPTATINGSTTVCQETTSPEITFTGANATAPYTFTYKINGGPDQTVTTTSGNSVTIAVPTGTPGTFDYSLVSVLESSSTACSQAQTGSASVIVNPLPTATINGSTTVCKDATPPLITFIGSNATAPYTFTYNINGGPDQTVTTTSGNSVSLPVATVTPASYTYTLVSVQESSSTACSQAQAGNANVIVNPLPTATINGSTTVCQGTTSPEILFTGANATAPYTFTYKINGGPDQTVTTTNGNSVSVPVPTGTPGSFTYSLVSVLESSSTACSQAQAGSATVMVNPLPAATINGSIQVCKDAAPPVITFTGANATAPYTFTYKINGGPDQTVTTTSGNSVTIAAPTGTPGIYNYSLVSVLESSSTACSQAQTGSASVTVNPLPTAIIEGSTSVCKDAAPPLITFTGANATAPYTFTYKINGGPDQTVTTTSGNSVTIPVPTGTPGIYVYSLVRVQESSSNTCSQAQTGNAGVTVNPLPDVILTQCFDPITIKNLPNKIILSGGYPIGAGGVFSGNGVSKNLISGNYEFDPNAVAANSTVTITYTYTDANTCFASKTMNIQVLSANADIIDATHMKDVRDNAVYTYKTLGTQKWMTQNLNYGNKIPYTQTQSDQCNVQKYCFESIDPTCSTFGGSYQWDELMRHDQGEASQGICPPGWHIPTEADWQAIVDADGGNGTASGTIQNSSNLNTTIGGIFYLNNVWAFTPSNTFKASMFWTSTQATVSGKPVARGLNAQGLFPLTPSVPRYESNRANAFQVRCVKN